MSQVTTNTRLLQHVSGGSTPSRPFTLPARTVLASPIQGYSQIQSRASRFSSDDCVQDASPLGPPISEASTPNTTGDGLQKELDVVTSSKVGMVPSTALVRAMGRKTPSMRAARGRGDRVFNPIGKPFSLPVLRLENSVFTVAEEFKLSAIISSSSADTFTATAFTVSSLYAISALTTLFDQYRIKSVEWMCVPRQAGYSGASTTYVPGLFVSVLDFDDSTALTAVAAALNYQNAMVTNGQDGHYRKFVPHAAIAAYSGAFTSYVNVTAPWIDAASTGVDHYGVKTAWQQTDAVYTMDVVVRLTTEWRNSR